MDKIIVDKESPNGTTNSTSFSLVPFILFILSTIYLFNRYIINQQGDVRACEPNNYILDEKDYYSTGSESDPEERARIIKSWEDIVIDPDYY